MIITSFSLPVITIEALGTGLMAGVYRRMLNVLDINVSLHTVD